MYPILYGFDNPQHWMTTSPLYTSNSQYVEADEIGDETQLFSPYVLIAWIVLCIGILTVAFINHQTMLNGSSNKDANVAVESDAMSGQMLDLDYEIIYPGQSCFQMHNCPLTDDIWGLLTHSYGENISYIVFQDYLPASGNEELVPYEGCLPMSASVYEVGHETVRPTACLLDVYGNLIIVTEKLTDDF